MAKKTSNPDGSKNPKKRRAKRVVTKDNVRKTQPKKEIKKANDSEKEEAKIKSTPKKRKAKRVVVRKVVKPRGKSVYNIVQGAVSDYCKRKYGRKCTKDEINTIYRELKSRYVDGFKNNRLSAEQISKTIDEKLVYKDKNRVPKVLKSFPYYDILSQLQGNDGLFFKSDDILVFDLSVLEESAKSFGILGFKRYEVLYSELEDFYTDELYPMMKEFFSEFNSEFGFEPSPPPEFVMSDDETDIENRTFVYYLDLSEVEGIDGNDTRPKKEAKKGGEKDVKVEDIDFDDDEGDLGGQKGVKKEVLEGGEGGSKGESEKVRLKELEIRDKELELKIKEEERKTKESETKKLAMELLRDGIIDKDEFKKLVGL
jgi:hypothetical protein